MFPWRPRTDRYLCWVEPPFTRSARILMRSMHYYIIYINALIHGNSTVEAVLLTMCFINEIRWCRWLKRRGNCLWFISPEGVQRHKNTDATSLSLNSCTKHPANTAPPLSRSPLTPIHHVLSVVPKLWLSHMNFTRDDGRLGTRWPSCA